MADAVPVELNVAGQRCRVVSSADEDELRALAAVVEEKIGEVVPEGRPVTTQAVVLAAIALAHEAKRQRERADAIADEALRTLGTLHGKVGKALEESDALRDERMSRPGGKRSRKGKKTSHKGKKKS